MIQELLGQSNYIGKDGFYWWIGQVETQRGSQPKKSDDRYKVRIVGQHLKDCNAVAYDDLPWAIVMMPATAPRREGNTDFQSVKYKAGDWVVGFFLDGMNGQQPVIMGSIGQQYNSTTQIEKDKPDTDCLAFTTFADKSINPSLGASATEIDNKTAGKPADLKAPPNTSNDSASKLLLATKCCNSETNPAGEYFCVEVADAKCEDGAKDKTKFQTILQELFFNIQTSGGQFGSKILSPYTGKLYNYIDIAQGYVNKTTRLASSLVGRVKGEVFALVKQGAKAIIQFLLTEEVVDPDHPEQFVGPYADPSKAVKPVKKRVGRLRGLTKWLNDQLKYINCQMEDLDKRLIDFITKLIFEALEKAFNAARCWVDKIVNDILNKILDFLNSAISSMLGALQELLTIIESPLNILGAALAKVFDLLGITCGGPTNKCSSDEQQTDCSGSCAKPGKQSDFLDDLIKAVENGNLDTAAGNCSDYQNTPDIAQTNVYVIGGVTNPDTYTDTTPVTLPPTVVDPTLSPTTYSTSPTTTPTTTSTTPTGTTTPTVIRPITTPPELSLSSNLLDNLNNIVVDRELVSAGTLAVAPSSVADTAFTVNVPNPSGTGTIANKLYTHYGSAQIISSSSSVSSVQYVSVTTEKITYALSTDKSLVFKGDTITFTLVANGGVVEDGTIFTYAMFGNIVPEIFSDGKTTGTMRMTGNIAQKSVTIQEDKYLTQSEGVTFNILETGSTVPFTIVPSVTTTTTTATSVPSFTPPVLGKPEVCDDGRIMDIPIISKGDAYIVPPIVVIEGAGFGASATADLDADGYLSKIVIKTPGTGYFPARFRNNCVISDFRVISPGIGYYNTPTVYVNGKSNVARAIIDENGYLSGVEVTDKTQTFGCTPKIEIYGGNGLGARVVPIMECRDDVKHTLYVEGIAPYGTDTVIDCP